MRVVAAVRGNFGQNRMPSQYSLGFSMAYQDEESPGLPLWQSVLCFFCKGLIEGIIVVLFVWLLVQVLFTKNLEVHLQILLGVGLAVFCFSLILGCILCWRRGRSCRREEKEAMTPPSAPGGHVNLALRPCPSAGTIPIKQQYEELDGDILEYPSTSSRSTTSEDDLSALPFVSRPRAASEVKAHPRSGFSLRRLSSPAAPFSAFKPAAHGRTSLPSIPKLGLVSKTHRVLERRCTVTGDSFLYNEHSRLTSPTSQSPSTYLALEESPIQAKGPSVPLGSAASSDKPRPRLHFTLLFSATQGTLTVTVLSLSGVSRRLGGAFVRASLPPLCPSPLQVLSRRRSLSPEFQSQSFVLQVGSLESLQGCSLRLTVLTRDFSGLRETALGELEMLCGEMDWESDHTTTCTRELSPAKYRLKKSLSSQEALGRDPRPLGQLLVLLQYQTLAHRIKVMVRKAESLAKLNRMPGAPDHYVVINMRHKGVVIGTKETKGASGYNAVWNAPFLFDLPPGDVTQLSVVLEFIIMQGRLYTKSSMLGHIKIGSEAPETGRDHWKDMCSRGQAETARWHSIQPVSL